MNNTLLEDAELALDKLSHMELQLARETEELFKSQVDHMREIDRLQLAKPKIASIEVAVKHLTSLVDSSSLLVDDVCGKFKKIDLAKSRLQDCLARISDIHDLRICRNSMASAMANKNYEEAAMHIKRFLDIDRDQLQKTIGIICGKQVDEMVGTSRLDLSPVDFENLDHCSKPAEDVDEYSMDFATMKSALSGLDEARASLLKLCQEEFHKAVVENNVKDVERFFKIFPMLHEHNDGLVRYAEYLKDKIVNQQVDEILKSSKLTQADKLASLYENIAKLVDTHQPLIETYYGPGHLIVIIRVLQKQCDILSRKLLEEFRNVTNLQNYSKLVRNVSLRGPNALTGASSTNIATNSKPDPRDIDSILNQISLIIARTETYLNFVVQRIKDDIRIKSEDEAQNQSGLHEIYNLVRNECDLNYLVQEVSGIYVMLEQYYLYESSKLAISVDQIDSEMTTCFTSSMLDDIFFIIKKCTKRAISTKSNEIFCAIINYCVTLLDSTFCQVLDDRLKMQQYYPTTSTFTTKNLDLSQAYNALQSGRYLQSSSYLETSKAQYFSALNNLDKACDYIVTMRKFLDVDIKKLKPSLLVMKQNLQNHLDKSINCLNDLSHLVVKFNSTIDSSLYQLFNSSLKNSLKAELKKLMNDNMDLDKEVFNNPDGLERLAGDLLATLDSSLQNSLTRGNYSKLINIIKREIK